MEKDKLVSASKATLDLVLGFFPRVDAKFSVILAINTGMLAFLATSAPPIGAFSRWMEVFGGITIVLVVVSFLLLYAGSFPNLKGGEASLIYFREIAKHREQKFVQEFSKQSERQYADDLLCQVWRNSQILTMKFDCLKRAFIFMALAIPAWIVTLFLFASTGTHSTGLFHQ
jgi:hypothetical protein